jgi:ABC-type sugar transport system substrate-binding protein
MFKRRLRITLSWGLSLCAVAIAALALAACGSSSSSSTSSSSAGSGGSSSSTASTSVKKVHLAIITADSVENAFQEMAYGAQAAAAHIPGVSLSSEAPSTSSGTAEVSLFQSAQQTSKAGIAVETVTPPDFTRPFSEAISSGIPIVAVDSEGVPGSGVTTFVGNSNVQLGDALAKQMLNKIPASASGQIVIGNPIPGLPLLASRIDGFMKTLKAARPHLTFVGPFNVGNEPTQNYDTWNSLVQKYPNAVAYMDPGDQGGVSFGKIEQSTGKHYLFGGCDVNPAALQAVQHGYVYALVDPHHFLKGYIALTFLADHAQHGTPIPKGWFNPGYGVVTKANVAAVIAREKNNSARYAFYAPIIKKELADPSAYIKPLADAN